MKYVYRTFIAASFVIALIIAGCGDDTATSSPPDTGVWKQSYGDQLTDIGFSLAEAGDGGYFVAGMTQSSGGGDILLMKIDSVGDSLCSKTIGGASAEAGFGIMPTNDGAFVIVGVTESFGSGAKDVYLVKVNSSGDTLWTRTYGGASDDEGHHVIQATDGGFLVAGMTESSGAGTQDAYVIKTDSTGSVEWSHTYGGAEVDYARSCIQTADGGFAVAGTTHSLGVGESDVYLIRLQADGTQQWARALGEAGAEQGMDLVESSTGTLWVVGSSDSFDGGTDSYVGESGGGDAYVLMVNAAGNKVSSSGMGATGNDFLSTVVQTSDGRVIGLGFSQSPQGWSGIYAVQVSPYTGGVHHQSNLYGTTSYCYAHGGIADLDGDIVAVGGSVVPGNVDILIYNIGPWGI